MDSNAVNLDAKPAHFSLNRADFRNDSDSAIFAPSAPREVLGDSRLELLGASANPGLGLGSHGRGHVTHIATVTRLAWSQISFAWLNARLV